MLCAGALVVSGLSLDMMMTELHVHVAAAAEATTGESPWLVLYKASLCSIPL